MFVQFEHGQENRFSEKLGPFEFVQLTYADIRVGKDGETQELGCIGEDGYWYLSSSGSGPYFTDVIISKD